MMASQNRKLTFILFLIIEYKMCYCVLEIKPQIFLKQVSFRISKLNFLFRIFYGSVNQWHILDVREASVLNGEVVLIGKTFKNEYVHSARLIAVTTLLLSTPIFFLLFYLFTYSTFLLFLPYPYSSFLFKCMLS